MTIEQGAFLVSILAFLVSGIVGISQWQVSKRMAAIEESRRLEEITAGKRAKIVARIQREPGDLGTSSRTFLSLKNEGAVPARNVTVEAKTSDLHEFGLPLDRSPIPVLAAGQDYRMPFMTAYRMADSVPITVGWEDDFGLAGADFTLSTY